MCQSLFFLNIAVFIWGSAGIRENMVIIFGEKALLLILWKIYVDNRYFEKHCLYFLEIQWLYYSNLEQCGQTNVPVIKTVEEAVPNQWPWLAHIQSRNTECGGTLVHPKWVVTSAQCVGQNTPSTYTITLGEHDLTS